MAKKQKSSASSATRKKHALKATGGAKQELPLPKEKKEKGKGKGKGKNKEPRVKVFIPPSKPVAVRPDPLDSLGIAKSIPADLLVVLRRLGKKDSVTKRKALEELQNNWIDGVLKGDDEGGVVEATLETSLPVWIHHIPSLLLSASRRIRLLAATIHTALLRIPSIHEQFTYFLREAGDATQIEAVLGSWCMAAEDVERSVAIQAKQAWDLVFRSSPASGSSIDLDESSLNLLLAFIKRSLFDPLAVYTDLNPVQPAFVPTLPAHAARNKGGTKRPALPPVLDEDTVTRRTEEEEESEGDRKGRLRGGALGVLRWILENESISISEQLSELLISPLLWTGLYHGPVPPFCSIHSSSGFIGDGQPIVRKVAWSVLRALLKFRKSHIETTLLPTLSSAILRSAWVEPDSVVRTSMWEPLLVFLTQYSKSWEIDLATAPSVDDPEESDDETDHETSEDQHDGDADDDATEKAEDAPPLRSEAFREFLLFLQLGCYGSPVQGYPTVILILSTLPISILGTDPEAWADLLTSFWAALDGRALTSIASERALGSAAFLSAILECTVLLVKRSRAFNTEASLESTEGDSREMARAVVRDQMTRVWEELVKERLRILGNQAGKLLARTFASLESLDDSLFAAAWEPIISSVTAACSPHQSETAAASTKRFTSQLSILKGLLNGGANGSGTALNKSLVDLVLVVSGLLIEQADEQLKSVARNRLRSADATSAQRLGEMFYYFGNSLFSNTELASRIDTLMRSNISPLLSSEPSLQLLLAFLTKRNDDAACLSLWHVVLQSISSDTTLQEQALPDLLIAAEKGSLSRRLRPEDDEMDGVATKLVADVLSNVGQQNDEVRRTVVRRLLEQPHSFISLRAASGIVHNIAYAFSEKSRDLMRDTDSSESVVPLRTPLMLLSSVIEARPEVAFSEDIRSFLPDFFVFGHVLPRAELLSSEAKALCAQARQIWSTGVDSEGLGLESRDELLGSVRTVLRDLITDVDSRAAPEAVLQVIAEGQLGNSIDILTDLFPSQDALEDRLRELPSNPLDPILAIVDPLIPPASTWSNDIQSRPIATYDRSGLCEYSRVVNSLLLVAADNRDLARANMWLLRHFLTLSNAATERHMLPSATSAFFSQEVAPETLLEISARVKTVTALLLSDISDETWHKAVIQSHGKADLIGLSTSTNVNLARFMLYVLASTTREDKFRESKVLYTAIQHVLSGASAADAEQWIGLARRIDKESPNSASAIIRAVNESSLEPPSLDRYRNEIAAGLLGVRASKADSDGLRLLRRLALVAPDPESDVIFLPQNRAVNFMKVCQGWIVSDDDIGEDVESEMTLVFQHLAPILQSVPGAHWDLVFDVIENNLENCSFSEDSSLTPLSRTLKLILVVQDLASMNKSLRADWQARELHILKLVRSIVETASASNSNPSEPRSICWEMALTIVQNLPPSLIDHESLSKMTHLILDPSPEVAKMAYSLLLQAARKRTEYLVVEAGVDTSSETVNYELPTELIRVIEAALDLYDNSDPNNKVILPYLLGWMLIFDLFDDASLRVKMGYATQLRDLDLIGSSLLPFIFDLLELYGGRNKSFPLDQWSVEEYFVSLYDPDSPFSPRLLAAHLFYRALLNVPSLIATWWGGCKDRQLLAAVASLTSKYYSPVLIAAELRHVKDPAGVAELSGENWGIKVAAGIGEVTAAYTVDDQDMEIAVRLPSDYPLHGIEVREVQKLGVEEKRWRGWLLAVQQIVTSQNGRIVDGLSMFKKNVTHHFENQTECAICYSIISVTELSLPKKRCKTCKNRFHAGCLFKWFNTSHTSSCPLCRSDFI